MPSAPKKSAGPSSAAAQASFDIGDIVLGRLKGFPLWPSRIVDPENTNAVVAKARPSKSPSVYCVQFFPAGDHAWLNVREIKPLPKHQIQAWLQESHRTSGELKKAYETALNPSAWATAQSEWAAARAENEDQLEGEDEDEMDGEDEEEDSKSKKRKAPKSKGKVEKKKTKVEKAEPKAKAPKKTPASKATDSKKAPESQAPADEDALASDPVCVKVKDWRHKLQRAFLSKSLPSAEDMDAQNEIFKAIEEYKGMTIQALTYSKIGKVMKKIVTLDGIPRNDELKITERAQKLMDGWAEFIDSAQSGPNGTADANGNDAGASNGDAKPKSKSAKPKSEAEPAAEAKKPEDDVEAAEKKAEGADVEAETKAEANGNGDAPNEEAKEEEKKDTEVPGQEAATA